MLPSKYYLNTILETFSSLIDDVVCIGPIAQRTLQVGLVVVDEEGDDVAAMDDDAQRL